MLLITNDGRKLALDQRLIDPLLPDSDTGKVAACAENVYSIWKRTSEQRSTQMVFCDGKKVVPMPLVQDHKRAYEGDVGPNTGGMGSYSDSTHILPFISQEERQAAIDIIQSVIDAMAEEGCPYHGVLYGQFMLTVNGPKIIEFNARFGDPEAMNVLSILETGFQDVCLMMADGNLPDKIDFAKKATVCKYVVPKGYGVKSEVGKEISFDVEGIKNAGAVVYYANIDEKDGKLVTMSSRSAGIVGMADTIEEAEQNCENALEFVKSDWIFVRHDIGKKELVQKRVDHMNQLRSA